MLFVVDRAGRPCAYARFVRIGDWYRLTWVCGYAVGGRDYYAAIWQNDGGPALWARHGLSNADYQAAFDIYTGAT